jgi:predicted RNase H-like nuclease (RuvC/YqgF family)
MFDAGIKWVIGVGLVLGTWILKTISNAHDPDRSVKKEILSLFKRKNKLLRQKRKLENSLKSVGSDHDKKIAIGSKLSNIHVELSRLRKRLEELANWR